LILLLSNLTLKNILARSGHFGPDRASPPFLTCLYLHTNSSKIFDVEVLKEEALREAYFPILPEQKGKGGANWTKVQREVLLGVVMVKARTEIEKRGLPFSLKSSVLGCVRRAMV